MHPCGIHHCRHDGSTARVKSNPDDTAAWQKLARWLTETWHFARADVVIEQALALFGDDAALLTLQVFAKQELGQADVART